MCLWWGLYELFIAVIIRGCICGGVYVSYLLLLLEDVPLVGFVHFVFTGMPGESYSSPTRLILLEDVPLVGFVHFVFTGMPGESYSSPTRFFLRCLCDVFRALIM